VPYLGRNIKINTKRSKNMNTEKDLARIMEEIKSRRLENPDEINKF